MEILTKLTSESHIMKLKEILEKSKTPLYESHALKHVFELKDISSLAPIDLYRYHFALFRMLYHLQDYYYSEGRYLHVHFMRIALVTYPPKDECHEYDEYLGQFCKETCTCDSLYCDFHMQKHEMTELETQSLKYFYFSDNNYQSIDESKAAAFINGTWELLFNYADFAKSIKILDLPENCNLTMVKTAYRKLARKYHPDINEQHKEKFLEINDAYCFLNKTLTYIDESTIPKSKIINNN